MSAAENTSGVYTVFQPRSQARDFFGCTKESDSFRGIKNGAGLGTKLQLHDFAGNSLE